MTEQIDQLTPFQVAARKAEEQFEVIASGGSASAAYLSAEAGTGSRYAVVVSKLPFAALPREGGTHLISLIQPWQASMVFTVYPGEHIHPDYIAEKLMGDRRHGGDTAAVVLAVNKAVELFDRVVPYAKQQLAEATVREAGL